MNSQSNIRIIGGKWRSRKVSFADKESLRPTPDRVRETLFNWLAPYIRDAVCLDLFAGSGVLGFEALSRGAKSVLALDQDHENIAQLIKNKQTLLADNFTAQQIDTLTWLQKNNFSADLVFVDPPYKDQLLLQVLQLLEQKEIVHAGSLIYFEQDQAITIDELPATWTIWRHDKAGKVFYYLALKNEL